jgi:hypothetical protein
VVSFAPKLCKQMYNIDSLFMYHCTPKEHGMFINIFCIFIRLSQQSYQLASKACVGNPVNVLKCRYSTKSVLILPVDPMCTTGDM